MLHFRYILIELKDPSMACDSKLYGWVVSLPRSLLPKTSNESLNPMYYVQRPLATNIIQNMKYQSGDSNIYI